MKTETLFEKKCKEVHLTLCYLDNNPNVPIGDVFETINVWFGHVYLNWSDFINCSVLECAVRFIDERNNIANMIEKPKFSIDKWTMV